MPVANEVSVFLPGRILNHQVKQATESDMSKIIRMITIIHNGAYKALTNKVSKRYKVLVHVF